MTYHAKAATVGNSRALRLDSALFREHPEFATGEFAVSVIAPGCLLVQTTTEVRAGKRDPVFDAFLSFVEHQMAARPDLISAVTSSDRRHADEVLRGVPADPDADLGDEFELPAVGAARAPRKRSTHGARSKRLR